MRTAPWLQESRPAALVVDAPLSGAGKITQTYSVDPEHHQLRIVASMEGHNGQQPRTITHVYDADAR